MPVTQGAWELRLVRAGGERNDDLRFGMGICGRQDDFRVFCRAHMLVVQEFTALECVK